jgi:hypothetical protein
VIAWCTRCEIDPEKGCRHPLGTECCPYRPRPLSPLIGCRYPPAAYANGDCFVDWAAAQLPAIRAAKADPGTRFRPVADMLNDARRLTPTAVDVWDPENWWL